MASPLPIRSATNPRTVIVEYTKSLVDRAIGRPDRIALSDILQDVEARFLSDQNFVLNLAIMNVKEIAQAAIREAVAETRGPSRRVIVRNFITTPADMVAQTPHLMAALSLRWGRFMEWDGTVHIRLTSMTRADLLKAAAIRRERAVRELAYADFFVALANQLPDDTTTVGVAIPVAEIERIYVAIQEQHGRLDPIPGTPADQQGGGDTDTSPDADASSDSSDDDSPSGAPGDS
jgi:hypothetical protein